MVIMTDYKSIDIISGIDEALKLSASTSPKIKYYPILLDASSINKDTK